MSGPPERLAASAAALRENRPEEALACLADEPFDGPWRAVELGLRGLAASAVGAPMSERQAYLDAFSDVFQGQLEAAKELLEDRTPNSLADAGRLCGELVTATILLGSDFDIGQALARNLRMTIWFHEGRTREASEEAERAMALLPTAAEAGKLWATIPINAASIACELGSYALAETYIARGLEHMPPALDDPELIGDLLRIAADVQHAQGRFLEARQKMVTVVSVFEAFGIVWNRKLARARATLATLEREFGRAQTAADLGRAAVEAWPMEEGDPEYGIAAAHVWTQWALAADWKWLRERLPAVARAAVDAGPTYWTEFLTALGLVCFERRRFRAAERIFARIIDRLDTLTDDAMIERIDTRRHHALAAAECGDVKGAFRSLQEAGKIVEAAGSGARIFRHVLARDHGMLAERCHDPEAAVDWYLRAIHEEASNLAVRLGLTVSIAEAFEHRDAIDAMSALFRLVVVRPDPERIRQAHQALLVSRGCALRGLEAYRSGRTNESAADVRRRAEISRLVEWGFRLQSAGHTPPDLAALTLALTALDTRLTVGGRPLLDEPPRSLLPDRHVNADEAVIDFVVTIEGTRPARDIRIYAFMTLAQASHPVLLDWRDAAALLVQIEDLRQAMPAAEERGGSAPGLAVILDELSREFWWPIEKHLPASVRRLLLRTDGNLANLPFAALHGPSGIALCERFEFVLLGPGLPQTSPNRPIRDFLVVGDPAPSRTWRDRRSLLAAAASGRKPGVMPTGRLRNSRREARRIAALLKSGGSRDGTLLLGVAASRQSIMAALPARFVHLAMHGFAFPRDVEGRTPREHAVVGHPAPDLRAGLVCAGAEAWLCRTASLMDDDDGLLLARDVALMDLRDVELVVLAACDTGFGEPAPGEGMQALADAFLAAGVKAVIASAWALDDAETTRFMEDLYALVGTGMPPPAALRRVQSAWSTACSHPRFWAAFNAHVRESGTPS